MGGGDEGAIKKKVLSGGDNLAISADEVGESSDPFSASLT